MVWMLGVANSYTMEASFGGSELGSRMSTHFSVQDYESLGRTFCETLLDFYDEDPSKERLRTKIVTRLLKEGSNADEPTNIDLSDYSRFVISFTSYLREIFIKGNNYKFLISDIAMKVTLLAVARKLEL